MADTKYQVSKNILYNFLGQSVLLFVSLVTAPYIIHTLGNNKYAILTLVTTIVGYFSILDLGLGASIIKYVSESNSKKDVDTLEKIINTSLTMYLAVGLVGAFLIVLFTQSIVKGTLKIPLDLIPVALSVFYISAFGFLVNMVLTVFNSIPNALERMDITNKINILFGVLNTLGTVVLLALNQDMLVIIIWNVLVSTIATAVFLKIVSKLLPHLRINLGFDKTIFLKMIKFGFFKSLANISGQVVFQLDKLLIGIFYPIAAITYYVVPAILVQKGFSAMFNITNAFFPALSSSYTLKEGDRVEDLYLRMTKFIILFIFPVMAVLFIFAKDILTIWLGVQYAQTSTATLKILALAYFLAALSAPGVIVSDAFGKPQLPAFFALISALINLVAALILIPKLGFIGAAWAMVINFIAQVPIFIIVVHKKVVRISHSKVVCNSLIKPLVSGLIAGVLTQLALSFIENIALRLLLTAFFVLVYLLLNYLIGSFDGQDKKIMIYFINKFRLLFKRA